ncbi:hypothetical protein [Duncaniella muris]|uniref:hypothetical protein n=1 Tax=Duncaniella muris TaxID=2094150 RepID=UPI003F66E1CD
MLGAALLRSDGLGEDCARVAERHTGAGLSREDIARQHLPLDPDGDYMPQSTLERLVCYADKFYSKSGDMQRKPLEKVIRSMQRLSPETLERFMVPPSRVWRAGVSLRKRKTHITARMKTEFSCGPFLRDCL